MSEGINVLTLSKPVHRYIFLFDDASRSEVLKTFGRLASDPAVDFTWFDAAVLAAKVRAESNQSKTPRFQL